MSGPGDEYGPRGSRAFIALGSNAHDAIGRLERALRGLADAGERIAAVARPVRSPFEDAEGRAVEGVEPVVNTVAELRTGRAPSALLDLLFSLEAREGRERTDPGVRTLDADLLDAGVVLGGAELTLPHRRALGRGFVLGPWSEIGPLHAVTGTGRAVVSHAAALRARQPEAFDACVPLPLLRLPEGDGTCEVLEDAAALRAWREPRRGLLVGVVPTMGALHAGHEALLRRARAECDAVLATLFVNPLQFDPGEDLARYPRTFEADRALLGRLGCDVVYAPRAEDLYPDGYATYIEPEGPARGLEGTRRPGHFRGVATVVHALWRRTRPDRAYFGRKDAQQLAVVRRMQCDLELGGALVACPTVHEADGLALSSRNRYLSSDERERAVGLSRALETMAVAAARGTVDAEALKVVGMRVLDEAGLDVEYLEIVDAETMQPVAAGPRPALAVSAVRVGGTRLLDNRWLVAPGTGTA